MKSDRPLARWVKSDLYKEMTGHTKQTLYILRSRHLKEGTHWKRGLEGPSTFYYNHERIDAMLDPQ